jgi:hypothetical protein
MLGITLGAGLGSAMLGRGEGGTLARGTGGAAR